MLTSLFSLFSLFLYVTGECPAQVFTLRMSPCSVCIFLENSYFQAWIDHFTVEYSAINFYFSLARRVYCS